MNMAFLYFVIKPSPRRKSHPFLQDFSVDVDTTHCLIVHPKGSLTWTIEKKNSKSHSSLELGHVNIGGGSEKNFWLYLFNTEQFWLWTELQQKV